MMKEHFKNSIVYYYNHLVDNGCLDPIKKIIGDFLSTVEVSDVQKDYILSISGENKKILDNVLVLISKMRVTNQFNKKEIEAIENSLKYILNKK